MTAPASGAPPRGAAALAGGALVLAWLLSSLVSRGKGLLFFLALAAPLWPALALFRRGRRSALYGYCYLLLLGVAAGGGVELALRLKPGLLEGPLANVAYTGYHWQGGGVYDLDPQVGPVLRPSVRRRMYWSGHWWWHETNAGGFRGPALERAEAVFLGDSMIYGHGVEEADTLPARFARRTSMRAANLGQQGTCLIQAYLTLREKGLALRPRQVFVCVHFTDVEDGLTYYEPAELRRFVEGGAEAETNPRVRARFQPPPAWRLDWLWSRHVALPTQAGGILGAVARGLRGGGPPPAAPRDPFVPTAADLEMAVPGLREGDPEELRLAWRAQRQALARIKRLSDGAGARLIVFDLGYPRGFTEAVQAAAHAVGAEYNPAGRVAARRALAGEHVYLANDGHWTGQGAEVVAEELARSVDPR